MLSQKFKDVIYKILDDRENAKSYDITTIPIQYERSNSYSFYYQAFNELRNVLTTPDNDTFNNFICNYILSCNVLNNGKKQIFELDIENLKHLDYFSDENQNIVNKCLDAFYELDLQILEDLKFNLECKYILLKIYINKLIQKIYFVWKNDKLLYTDDIIQFWDNCKKYNIKFTPLDNYTTIYYNIIVYCRNLKYSDLVSFIQFIRSLFQKYKDIDIFNITIKQPQIKPLSIKYDLNDLNKLKVTGLKELCIKHKIIMKSKSIRNDYVNALLNFSC